MACISFTWDDSRLSQYEIVFPIMKRKSMKSTLYITTDWIDTVKEQFLSLKHLKEMYNHGWEIGSHTLSHISTIEKEDLIKVEYELKKSKETIENWGFECLHFARPADFMITDKSDELIKKYYKSQRRNLFKDSYAGNSKGNGKYSPYDLNFMAYDNRRTELILNAINNVIEKNEWLILCSHSVGFGVSPIECDISVENFLKVLDYIEKRNVKVVTIGDGLK